MATSFTGMTKIQDNRVSGISWLTINQPVAFIVQVSYTGDTPDYLDVEMSVDTVSTMTLKALPYSDPSSGVRNFIFFADEYMKAYMDKNEDFIQTNETIEEIELRRFDFEFKPPGLSTPNQTFIVNALDGVRQFDDEDGVCAVDLYNNAYSNLIRIGKDGFIYMYFRATSSPMSSVQIKENDVFVKNLALAIVSGNFYRFKYKPANFITGQINTLTIDAGSGNRYTSSFYLPYIECDETVIKYIDSDGLWQFMPFEKIETVNNQFTSLGSITNYVTSIVDVRGDKYGAGKDHEKEVSLNLLNFPLAYIDRVKEVFASPYIYLYVGDDSVNDDTAADWVEAEIVSNNLRYTTGKSDFMDISITVQLPKQYTIKSI